MQLPRGDVRCQEGAERAAHPSQCSEVPISVPRPRHSSLIGLLSAFALVASTLAVPIGASGAPAKVRLVVTFRSDTPSAGLDRMAAADGGQVVERIDQLKVRVVEVPAVAAEHVRSAWSRNPRVLNVETDGLLTVDWMPDDPLWAQQWEQRQVRARQAWNLERGGWQTVVAVVDTGVQRNHPDLVDRLVDGYDFVHNDRRPGDDNGHGTSVAGIIAATANSMGVAGMCPRCRIMPLKALAANGTGYWTVAAKAIIWAADHKADVINLSFGGPTGGSTLYNAVAYARSKGTVVIGAAGNFGSQNLFYPAAFHGVISVAASSVNDLQYDWSNYSSSWVDVSAPGCTWATKVGSSYGLFCGTSAATPVVSGIAALMDAARPGISRSEIESILTGATVDTPWSFTRFGRIDAYRAVYRAVHGRWPHSSAIVPEEPLFEPAEEVTLLAGNHAAYRFDKRGAILKGRSLELDEPATAHASKLGPLAGRDGSWFYLVDGPLAGYWIVQSGAVFLTPDPTPTPTPSPSPSPSP